jgi:hypothetical protein
MSHDKITEILNISHNLDENLRKTIEKKHDNTAEERRDGKTLNMSQAVMLSHIKDKKEQKLLAKALLRTEEARVREQGKLVTEYKQSPQEIKNKVNSGELDLIDVPIEKLRAEIKMKQEEAKEKDDKTIIVTQYKKYLREAGNRIGDTNNKILQTCAYLEGLTQSGILHELDWEEMNTILEEAKKYGNSYAKFVELILNNL